MRVDPPMTRILSARQRRTTSFDGPLLKDGSARLTPPAARATSRAGRPWRAYAFSNAPAGACPMVT